MCFATLCVPPQQRALLPQQPVLTACRYQLRRCVKSARSHSPERADLRSQNCCGRRKNHNRGMAAEHTCTARIWRGAVGVLQAGDQYEHGCRQRLLRSPRDSLHFFANAPTGPMHSLTKNLPRRERPCSPASVRGKGSALFNRRARGLTALPPRGCRVYRVLRNERALGAPLGHKIRQKRLPADKKRS